jgi:dihydrofolate reductase
MKASVYIGTSLDGFIAREDGDIAWLTRFADENAVQAYNEFIKGIDSIIIGRGTFETVLTFPDWPYQKPVFVLSRSRTQLPDKLGEQASLISLKPAETLTYLSDLGYRSAYVDGGKVIQSFLEEDLIDDLTIATVPVLLGSGIPLFGRLSRDLNFTHLRTATFSNGLVRSYYRRTNK